MEEHEEKDELILSFLSPTAFPTVANSFQFVGRLSHSVNLFCPNIIPVRWWFVAEEEVDRL